MASRKNLSHNKLLKNRKQERQQEFQAQQDQQLRARVDGILINAASNIYSGLVTKEWDGSETEIPREVLLRLATTAKNAANVLGESLGMLNPPNIQVVEVPKPTDEVVEIPASPDALESSMSSTSSLIVLESPAPDSPATESSVVASESPTIVLESPAPDSTATESSVVASESPTIVLESPTLEI